MSLLLTKKLEGRKKNPEEIRKFQRAQICKIKQEEKPYKAKSCCMIR
jgi:hypothetical protein